MFIFFAFVVRVNFNFRRTNGSHMTPPLKETTFPFEPSLKGNYVSF